MKSKPMVFRIPATKIARDFPSGDFRTMVALSGDMSLHALYVLPMNTHSYRVQTCLKSTAVARKPTGHAA
jgi:hypothetical protein